MTSKQRKNLVMSDDLMELDVGGETEEYVHDVGRKFHALPPVFAQHPPQRSHHRA